MQLCYPLLALLLLANSSLVASARAVEVPPRPSNGSEGKFGTYVHVTMDVDGKQREFRLVAPEQAFADGPAPLVFAFHGLFDSKNMMSLYSRLDRLAKSEKFVLVYPNGRNRHWPLIPGTEKLDLAFFDKLYDKLTEKYNIDLNRVYLTGMSNGAYFSHLIAKQRSDRIAAIAPHSGGLGALYGKQLKLQQKYAVLVIHGTADKVVKPIESERVRDYYQKWGHSVEYVEVQGLGHFWAHRANVNQKMWTFFEQHPLQPSQ